jgi:hypothetical protein
VWNIPQSYLYETGPYLPVTTRNIPQFAHQNSFFFSNLAEFGPRSENPRVGGSIPPLATINLLSFQHFLIEQFRQLRLVCQECAMDLRISGKPRQIASGQVSEGAISRHTTRVSQFELPGIVLSAMVFD